jgi:non-ribosomal peptide synthetase component F
VAVLAARKSGAAYLPLDPDAAANRIAFVLQDSEAPAAVTSRDLRDRLPSGTWRVVDRTRDAAQIRQPEQERVPDSEIRPEDLVQVI